MTKVCNSCGLSKPLTQFPRSGKFKDGTTRYRPDCKECYNIKRKLSKKRMSKFLNNTKHRTGEEEGYLFDDWKDAVMYFRGECAYCGRSQSRNMRLTRDHIVPVSKGGLTTRGNIIPSCRSCNCSKSNSDYEEWYENYEHYDAGRKERIDTWINHVLL